MQGFRRLFPVVLALLVACVPKSSPVVIPEKETTARIPVIPQPQAAAEVQKEGEAEVFDARTRKLRFFALLRPLVEAENVRILKLRQHVRALRQQGGAYSDAQLHEIRGLAQRYRVPLIGKPPRSFWSRLLKRVDVVPPELALAQAANESAWGTSRFARQGNNFFGQWCYRRGCGIVPARRSAGAVHEVKVFASPEASVRAYMHNLNTTTVYRPLRSLRLHLRRSGQPLDALLLAGGLSRYSERGAHYVKSIRQLIRRNSQLMQRAG